MSDAKVEAAKHLGYELGMLQYCCQKLAEETSGTKAYNCIVEFFAMHARVLRAVFYDGKPQKDDVSASQFFNDPADWKRVRPAKAAALGNVQTRAARKSPI